MSRIFQNLGLSGFVGFSLMVGGLATLELVLIEQPAPAITETLDSTPSTPDSIPDDVQIRQLTEEWFAAWSPGRNPVDWDAMGQLFVQTPGDLLVFDDAGGSVVVLDSWADYRATWEPFMTQFAEWQVEPEGDLQVWVSGDVATTAFTLTGGGVDQAGEVVSFRQRGTHVWQRVGDRWLIVHEHLTTDDL